MGAMSLVAPLILAGSGIVCCFTPGEDCERLIVNRVDAAAKEVRLQAYSFTSVPIVEALVRASKRGVNVRVLLDKSSAGGPATKAKILPILKAAKVSVEIDGKHAISHNKVIVVDGRWVVTGSYNFTASAKARNAENLVIIDDERIAKAYLANWGRHDEHSQ